MRVLILGGTRFIGRALTLRLLDEKHEVHLLTRTPEHAAFAPTAIVHPGDRREPASLASAAGHFDVVYDFLGFDAEDARVASFALAGRCNRLVHLSTGSVYWVAAVRNCPWIEADGTLPLRDRATCDAAEFDYGVAKRECEQAYREAAARDGFRPVFVRAPVVSGPGDYRKRDLFWVHRLLQGKPLILPDGGHNVFNHVYVGDLVEMLVRLATADAEPCEAFNAADRVFTTLREYVGRLASIVNREPRFADVPRAKIAAAGLDDRSFYFADTLSHVLDNRKAESRLLMSFLTPDRWMPPTVDWCRQQPLDTLEAPRLAIEGALAK